MYRITLRLDSLRCDDAESVWSSDKFALAGGIRTSEDSAGIALPLMRIDSGETRKLGQTFTIMSDRPAVLFAFQAWDLDQNDSWVDNEDDIYAWERKIASALASIPWAPLQIGAGIGAAVAEGIKKVVDQFVEWDHDDLLADYAEVLEARSGAAYATEWTEKTITFRGDDGIGLSAWSYTLTVQVGCAWEPKLFDGGGLIDENSPDSLMQTFRERSKVATKEGFVGGAVPTFFFAKRQASHYGGTIFFRHGDAEWRDIPAGELKDPDLADFGLRMRRAQDYATHHGYAGAFPTFFHATYDGVLVHGTVLLPRDTAEWRDIPFSELGGVGLDDVTGRFRAVNRWAADHGYVGGFPNMYHAGQGAARVGGTVLIKPGHAEWRDVFLFRDPG